MGNEFNEFTNAGLRQNEAILKTLEEERENSKRLKQELEFYRRYDSVSGLYNRATFYTETTKMLLNNRQKRFVMLRMDMERFKVINELWGRKEGDKLLRYIGDNLREKLSKESYITFARTEADIFYLCFLYSEENVTKMISYIETILSKYQIDFRIIPYFGLYIIMNHDMPINLMCDRTNLAIRTIKGNYMKRVAYYDDTLRKEMLWEQEIINQMGHALEEGQFEVYLQPQCNIQSGRPISAEALVRWIHPEKGMISPNEFIPIFERNGFIMKLDAYVWEQVCILLRKWINDGWDPHPISVNVSRINLYNPKLCDILIALVEKYELPPSLLELEITESAYADNQNLLIEIMEQLQKYGFTVLMDDFGSGYSSLNMLKEAVVDMLKLDLVFLSGKDKFDRGGNILASIVRMAKWLNLSVIAEGVETKQQADFLRSVGCYIAQGYYYARPMPVKDYETYLRNVEKEGSQIICQELKEEIKMNEFWDPNAHINFMFNNMVGAVGIFEWCNDNLEAIRLNDSFFDMIGESREYYYFKGIHVLNRIMKEDIPVIRKMLKEAIDTEGCGEGVYRRRCDDGHYMWLHTKVKYLAGDEDRSLFYVAMNDITDGKQAEENMIEESIQMRKLMEQLPGGIIQFSLKPGMPISYTNQNLLEFLGFSEKKNRIELNLSLKEWLSEADCEQLQVELSMFLNREFQKHKYYQTDWMLKKKDGSLSPFHLYISINTERSESFTAILIPKDQEIQMNT